MPTSVKFAFLTFLAIVFFGFLAFLNPVHAHAAEVSMSPTCEFVVPEDSVDVPIPLSDVNTLLLVPDTALETNFLASAIPYSVDVAYRDSDGDYLNSFPVMFDFDDFSYSPGVYYLAVYNNPTGFGYPYTYVGAFGYFSYNGFGDCTSYVPPSISGTRVDIVDPADEQIVATSSLPLVVGATGYVDSDDFNGSTYVRQSIRWRNTSAAVGVGFATGLTDYVVEELLSASGSFSVSSTTTYIQPGVSYLTTQIVKKRQLFGFTYWSTVVAATSTRFTIGENTALDDYYDNSEEFLNDIASVAADSCSIDFPFSFADLKVCIVAMFQTAAEPIASNAVSVADDFIHRAPWGYATRVIEIWQDDSLDTTLASLSLPLPAGLPVSGTIDFTPWDDIAASLESISDVENPLSPEDNMLDSFLFYWNTIWYILFALWLLREFYGAFHHTDFQHRRGDRGVIS